MEKQEHCGIIYGHNYNELGFLWHKVSSLFEFSLIKYEKDETFLNNITIGQREYYDFESRNLNHIYTTKPGEKIIYHDPERQIIIIIKNLIIFNVYAIQDELEKNRYFVGFETSDNSIGINTLGMILYFDDNGKLKEKRIISKVICNYDMRNSFVNKIMYKQSLIFTQIHRDTGTLMLDIILLSYDDILIAKHHYFEDIKPERKFSNETKVLNERFLHVKTNETNYLFDMGSTRLEKRENKYITKSIFNLNKPDKIKKIKEEIKEEEYNDGYPNNCIHCGQITTFAIYSYHNDNYCCSSSMGLGRGYCHDCKIRYSKTDKKWECCKLLPETNYMCANTVTKNNMCDKEHSTTMDTEIEYYKEPAVKYPYKKEINVTRKNI